MEINKMEKLNIEMLSMEYGQNYEDCLNLYATLKSIRGQ